MKRGVHVLGIFLTIAESGVKERESPPFFEGAAARPSPCGKWSYVYHISLTGGDASHPTMQIAVYEFPSNKVITCDGFPSFFATVSDLLGRKGTVRERAQRKNATQRNAMHRNTVR